MDLTNSARPSSPYWKFKAIDKNTWSLLENQELWFSHPTKFNDPFDTNLDVKKLVKQLEEKLTNSNKLYQAIDAFLPTYEKDLLSRLIFSTFRGTPENEPFKEVLMWSHYAQNHTGICIGLSMGSMCDRLREISSASRRRANHGIFDGSGFLDYITDAKVEYILNESGQLSESLENTIR